MLRWYTRLKCKLLCGLVLLRNKFHFSLRIVLDIWQPKKKINRPFYSCWLSVLATEWQRGWSWPCFDTDQDLFQSILSFAPLFLDSSLPMAARSTVRGSDVIVTMLWSNLRRLFSPSTVAWSSEILNRNFKMWSALISQCVLSFCAQWAFTQRPTAIRLYPS